MSKLKSGLWTPNQALVAPEWDWFWRKNYFSLPLWEGSGGIVRGYGSHPLSGDFTNNVAWAAGEYGPGLTFDGTDDWVDLGAASRQLSADGGSYDPGGITAIFVYQCTATTRMALASTGGTNPRIGWKINTSAAGTEVEGRIWFSFVDVSARQQSWGTTTDVGCNDPGWHVLICSYDRDASADTEEGRLWLDGVERTLTQWTSGNSGWSVLGNNLALGAQNDGAGVSDDLNGQIALAAFLQGPVNEAQALQISADPFGPFRMDILQSVITEIVEPAAEANIVPAYGSTLTRASARAYGTVGGVPLDSWRSSMIAFRRSPPTKGPLPLEAS